MSRTIENAIVLAFIVIVNMFLQYVLGFINIIIIILVFNSISGHVFHKDTRLMLFQKYTNKAKNMKKNPQFM